MDESLCIRSNVDPYTGYDSYNPDADDYDMRSAPLLPPTQSSQDIESKQVTALRRRIARGGSSFVITHYRQVVAEMEGEPKMKDAEFKEFPSELCKFRCGRRARVPSDNSVSTAMGSWDASDSDCMTPSSAATPPGLQART